MERAVRNNHVAVIYSPGYGAGWYTWHRVEELIFDPSIVYWIETSEYDKIRAYMVLKYPDVYVSQINFNLAIRWIPIGSQFRITEYDGAESVILQSEEQYLKA